MSAGMAASTSNVSLATSSGIPVGPRATYVAEGALAGANNKDMLSILNPAGSGKIIEVWEVWAAVPASSGATVIIPFEMRIASAVTGGTILTSQKYDSTDAATVAVVRTAPTGITDVALLYTWIEQINTAQGSTDAHSHVVADPNGLSFTKPITLQPGEALYLKQIAANTSTFRMGVYFTERTP